jgi:short-subunit dehydrogenase
MRIVITGAASGIGAALCRELSRTAEVIGVDRDDTDVTEPAQVAALAERAWPVDIWINCAGIAVGGAAEDLAIADWQRVIAVNLMGVVHGVYAVYPRMVARGSGQIVNIASVAGLAPYPLALPYTTSKHAVVGLSLALRAEAKRHGVRVNVACPGAVATPIWERSEVRGELAAKRSRIARLPKLSADACARAIVRGMAADRAVIPVTAEAHIAWRLARWAPAATGWLAQRLATVAQRR